MSIAKTQELQGAFMGGLAAWVIQVAVLMAWMLFGSHKLGKAPAGPAIEADRSLTAPSSLLLESDAPTFASSSAASPR